ncbi:MAG: 3'(2'),5'-bisphosphate nucleotidase CysQ [Gemmataceae bacterium]|nr:3'(2'),5'-bisphosphate nucleotidase CysQ [Gemmataceae bacterium]
MDALDRELAAALDAARKAGDLIRREYEAFAAIPDAPAHISTHVDKASQELILAELHRQFPADALCAEENTPALAGVPHRGRRAWVVDPIDGTRGFARKTGQFSVMIGFLLEGKPVVGVVLEPAQGRTTYARVGGGCWAHDGGAAPARCHVSARGVDECVVVQSRSKPGEVSKTVRAVRPAGVRETYSGGVKLATVARGEADVYANTYDAFYDWDICAGHVLLTEAGGRVTDLSGGAVAYQAADFSQRRGLLATNGPVHDEVLRRLKGSAGPTAG